MLPSLPQDIFVNIIGALDDQYTSNNNSCNVWHPQRVSTLQNVTLASRMLCTVAQPRLFAHIDFDAGEGAQGRAARLLHYFLHEGNGADSNSDETKRSRRRSVISFRLRDGPGASEVTPTSQTHWEPDLAVPLGRLLAFFVDAPNLRLFAFEGNVWTLSGAGQVVGYQGYVHKMSSKPSLRALALTNACNVPIDVFFTAKSHQQFTSGIRVFHISNVSFTNERKARDPGLGGVMGLVILHPIQRIKLGRLNYSQLFDMMHMRCNSLGGLAPSSSPSDISPLFHRLTSLSLAVSVVPAQMATLWNLVYGLRETLEHLEIRSYESISEKPRSSTLKHVNSSLLGFEQTFEGFVKLNSLAISTYILGKSTRFMDSAGGHRWGLPLVVDLLEPIMGCPIPKLRQVNLELFFMGGEVSAQTDKAMKNISLDEPTANSVWRKVDSLFMSLVGISPPLKIGIALHPFFRVKRSDATNPALADSIIGKSPHTGDTFGLGPCLPNLFARAVVDVRVRAIISDKDMLSYLQGQCL